MIRLPSLRHPTSFFDVFTVTVSTIVLVAIVLTIWHGSFVRLEMGVFTAIVFGWVLWAITRILSSSSGESTR
ncbi:hypothetical protein [Natronorubrum daqingense]|uniref:Uncharacterized protein n=1 Tax=Natronorubrum daqingense TaxID=588898 RepID=A0A1N7DR53_9EURY|nr:hypothetical protein [Natronorubrum daqingense]APX96125.1 hypothetical protein BB347_05535 [Natronorubrum daqingense]SIR78353.1 hypothetical protein SAMN05421809_2189 [Natronorubrum daqingense]